MFKHTMLLKYFSPSYRPNLQHLLTKYVTLFTTDHIFWPNTLNFSQIYVYLIFWLLLKLMFSDSLVWANSADQYQTAPRGSLIMVCTIRNTVCIFCMHYFMVKTSLFEFKGDYCKVFWASESLGLLQYFVRKNITYPILCT